MRHSRKTCKNRTLKSRIKMIKKKLHYTSQSTTENDALSKLMRGGNRY